MANMITELSIQVEELKSKNAISKVEVDVLRKKVEELEVFKKDMLAANVTKSKVVKAQVSTLGVVKCPKCQEVLNKKEAKSDLTLIKKLSTLFCVKCGYERSILE